VADEQRGRRLQVAVELVQELATSGDYWTTTVEDGPWARRRARTSRLVKHAGAECSALTIVLARRARQIRAEARQAGGQERARETPRSEQRHDADRVERVIQSSMEAAMFTPARAANLPPAEAAMLSRQRYSVARNLSLPMQRHRAAALRHCHSSSCGELAHALARLRPSE